MNVETMQPSAPPAGFASLASEPDPQIPGIDVHAIFDHVADGVVVLDRESNIILMNESAANLLGVERGPHRHAKLAGTFEVRTAEGDLLPPERWPGALALRGELLHGVQLQIANRDTGLRAIAIVSTAPIKDAAGETVQVLIIYRDITERMQFETMRSQLAAIVESSDDAMISLDNDGLVTTWNHGAEKMFGYTAAEMLGQSRRRLVLEERPQPLEEKEDEEAALLERIRAGDTVEPVEMLRRRKDGSEILVSISMSPIRDTAGRMVGACKVARDITAKRRLERQLQQSHKMEAIGQLTGGIAHDFNNLLGVVIGNLDLLSPYVEGDAAAGKRLATAHRAALRGADLTRRLLAFSCSEDLKPTLSSLEHAIRNTLELAQRALGPEIRMVVEIDRNVPQVMVDRSGLETLLLNLFVNARDAMPEGGVLTVSTEEVRVEEHYMPVRAGEMKAGCYARVSVCDTGHGMSPETMERAFEPFYTTKPRGRGTGLGLATAYRFVKQSGGTVRIYSELGYGTTISFYLPIVPVAGTENSFAGLAQTAGAECPGRGTVLIVDDEEDLLELASIYLEGIGCTVLRALDGGAALAILEGSAEVDVLMTDVIMPGGMNGATLAQRARQLRPRIRIVYSSGSPADALADCSLLLADGPLLRKPYQRSDLQSVVCSMLDGAGGGGGAA